MFDVILIFGMFLILLMGGLWAPFAIASSALVYIFLEGGLRGLKAIGFVSWGGMNSFTLTAIPLFLLLAELLLRSGVAAQVYAGLSRLVRKLPGGLLQTNIAGCAVFSAISGSSVATAAGIGTVALPQLVGRGYDRSISAGSLAAGGTLGILIPPSIAFIVYGTFTDTSVSQLFFAGLIPGIMMTGLFMLYVGLRAKLNPAILPQSDKAPKVSEDSHAALSWQTANDILPFAVLIIATLGSIYAGIATPTEAAAMGCAFSILIGAIWGKLSVAVFLECLSNAMVTSAGLMFIVFAAFLFSYAIGINGLGQTLANAIVDMDLSKFQLMLAIVLLYLFLGCVVESIGIMVITLPVLFPILLAYEFDLVWFGVMMVILIEVGQMTPPLGINLFVIQGIWDGRIEEVIRGVIPFFAVMLCGLCLIWAFPEIATFLPGYMITK